MNLDGLRSTQALLMARATSGAERSEWLAAATWLGRVEQDAREADEAAGQALRLALAGDLATAMTYAERACALEAPYHAELVWRPLRDAVAALSRTSAAQPDNL
jgi:hypothetical protein